jgi:nitroreductase
MLHALDIDASDDEASALFKFLDQDGNGEICVEEFLPWYEEAATVAKEQASAFQSLLLSRRTVDNFLTTDIDDSVLYRAVQCAIAAPNRRGSEPWRFIKLGQETIAQVAALKAKMKNAEDIDTSIQRWTQIPGWCVVTYPRSPSGNNWAQREDFKSVACAIENFMLSMWSEGIGSKWTDGEIQRTREFAEICGIDPDTEKIAGVIWYGFATTGLNGADPKKRKKGVDDVLEFRP